MQKQVLLFCLAQVFVMLLLAGDTITIESPGKNLSCRVFLNTSDGKARNLFYELDHKNKPVIKRSVLGIYLKTPAHFATI